MIVIIFARILLVYQFSLPAVRLPCRQPSKLLQLEPTRAAEKGTDAGERGAEEMEEGMLPCLYTLPSSLAPFHSGRESRALRPPPSVRL